MPAAANDNEIFLRLAKMEQTLARIDERTETMMKTHGDHETRIRALERASDKRSGALAVVGSVSGAIAGAIGTGLTLLITWLKGGS